MFLKLEHIFVNRAYVIIFLTPIKGFVTFPLKDFGYEVIHSVDESV